MRRTWRFLPSVMVSSTQEFASSLRIFLSFAGAVFPSSRKRPVSIISICLSSSTPLSFAR